MKLLILIIALLAGCNTVPTKEIVNQAPAVKVDNIRPSLRELTHADLQGAAKYAEDHGYPARAAKWRAFEAMLTASEGLVAACKSAIAAGLPRVPADPVGPLTLIEMGAEAVAQGVPAAVRANCAPIPLPVHLLPGM